MPKANSEGGAVREDLQCPTCEKMRDNRRMLFHSGVSFDDLRPFIHLAWGSERAQLDPEELRVLARDLMAAAEAADSDALVVRFLKERIGLELNNLGPVMVDMRRFRDQLREK